MQERCPTRSPVLPTHGSGGLKRNNDATANRRWRGFGTCRLCARLISAQNTGEIPFFQASPRSAVDAPAQFPGHVPGKAGPAPGSTSKPPRVSKWAAVSTPNRLSAPSDTPSRALCPCIALLGYARRGLSPVRHTAYQAGCVSGCLRKLPTALLACAPAETQVIATCIRYMPSTFARASWCALRCVAIQQHSAFALGDSRLSVCLSLPLRPATGGLPCALGMAKPLLSPEKRGRPAGLRSRRPCAPARQSVAWPVGHSPGGASTVTCL